ncbi:hypothetical protein COP2_043757 [Malus domestica]
MYTTCLEVGAFVDIEISVPEESRKPSSFFVHCSSRIKPQRPFGSTIIHLQDQAPTALEESVLRSSFIRSSKIKPQRPFGSTIIHFQDQAPTALEESVLRSSFFQDQAPTALWINKRRQIHTSNRSSRLSPKALEDLFITVSSRSSPKALEDPLKSTFKDQAHGLLKKLPTVHPRSSLDGPWINETPTNQHLTEIESEDQNRERL